MTIRQKTKLRNAFNNNMSTDLTLSKAQISKIIQSGGFLGSLLSKLAGPLMKVAVPLAKNILASLDSNILLKEVTKTIKNKTKEQKGEFLNMLLGTLGATLLGNILAGKGVVRAASGGCSLNSSTSYGNKKGKGIVRAGYGNKKE